MKKERSSTHNQQVKLIGPCKTVAILTIGMSIWIWEHVHCELRVQSVIWVAGFTAQSESQAPQ